VYECLNLGLDSKLIARIKNCIGTGNPVAPFVCEGLETFEYKGGVRAPEIVKRTSKIY
jgi:hypothetical protein